MSFLGFVPVRDRHLYAEYLPAKDDLPLLVLLNGLSDSVRNWDAFIPSLVAKGYGILRFDFRGQGQTLQRELKEKGSFDAAPLVQEQTDDLLHILSYFQIKEPIHIVGMSYGGGIALDFAAKNPEKTAKLILISPYLIRLDLAFPLQRVWLGQMQVMRSLGVIPESAAEAARNCYNRFLNHYMDHRFHRMVPDPALRNAAIQLTFGIMDFNAFRILSALPSSSVHLVSVGRDTLVPQRIFSEMWSKLPARIKESWLFVEDGEHTLIDQYPDFIARWTNLILAQDPRIQGGRKFRSQGYSFEIWDEQGERILGARPGWKLRPA